MSNYLEALREIFLQRLNFFKNPNNLCLKEGVMMKTHFELDTLGGPTMNPVPIDKEDTYECYIRSNEDYEAIAEFLNNHKIAIVGGVTFELHTEGKSYGLHLKAAYPYLAYVLAKMQKCKVCEGVHMCLP